MTNLIDLKKMRTVEGDLEIARRVVENDTIAVNYFLGEFSNPILDYVGKEIMHADGCHINDDLHYYMAVSGDYYEFIGAKFEKNTPGSDSSCCVDTHGLYRYDGVYAFFKLPEYPAFQPCTK